VSPPRIQGHDVQRRAFARAVASGRLAHAYLLVGPPGIGKRPFAAELAKALLCENHGTELIACNVCGSCTLMDAGNHPDFFAVGRPEDKNEFPAEIVRELCRCFSLKPARGRGKIALLDDADDLNAESANSFLKTLEEPPPHSFFFLVGTNPERQLPTVVSRCQVVRFAPLADDLVAEILRRHGVTDATLLQRLLHLGQGSPGKALSLADPELWNFRKEFIAGLVEPRPNSVALAKALMKFVQKAGKETSLHRRRAGQVLRLLVQFFDDALAVCLGKVPRLVDAEELAMLRNLAERLNPERLLKILERCLEADQQIAWYVQLVLVLEGLLDTISVDLAAK
jgi:DNA polymerase III subunit delta'